MLNARNDKSLVIIIVRDHSGCSHVRLRWNAMYYNGFDSIGFTPIITPQPIFDATILKQTKAIIYQRPIGDQDIAVLQEYKIHQKKFGYKIVFECDDQIFDIDGEGLPEYNMCKVFREQIPRPVCLPIRDKLRWQPQGLFLFCLFRDCS